MIKILPMEDRVREAQLLEKHAPAGDKARVLLMTERGAELGYVALELTGRTLWLLEIYADAPSAAEEGFFMDTLIRSAASYGETNGADCIKTRVSDYNLILKKMGFEVDEAHAFAPMSLLVHYN